MYSFILVAPVCKNHLSDINTALCSIFSYITIIKLNTGLIYQAANNYMTLLPFALRSSSRFFCCIPAQVPNVGVPLSYIQFTYIP